MSPLEAEQEASRKPSGGWLGVWEPLVKVGQAADGEPLADDG